MKKGRRDGLFTPEHSLAWSCCRTRALERLRSRLGMVARPRAAVSRFSSEPTPTAFTAPLVAILSSANSALQATPTRTSGHNEAQHVYRGAAQLVELREEAVTAPRTRKRTRDRAAARRFQRVKRDDLGWTTDTRHLEERQWQLPHAEGCESDVGPRSLLGNSGLLTACLPPQTRIATTRTTRSLPATPNRTRPSSRATTRS